eukprot:Gregarina_sp_Poly_1__2258@NODE_15_length_23029_cov_81_474305_g13_i0_p8_GENE_NODE_15_length_23029_cov_81_474305_g13_i0NODE_15_length_23029_cov_81_474305_g13_i0_p8_ORF_typecomplete_len318_score57_14Collagen_mid/PF15984_5/0_00087YlbD_coat/PF14071_6/1_6e03YlbD_coat/PF14071_6/1_1e02YlbD_coat/PF14071_6/2_3_NODE_15_length_23029_cov_81_474305_g13_i056516604
MESEGAASVEPGSLLGVRMIEQEADTSEIEKEGDTTESEERTGATKETKKGWEEHIADSIAGIADTNMSRGHLGGFFLDSESVPESTRPLIAATRDEAAENKETQAVKELQGLMDGLLSGTGLPIKEINSLASKAKENPDAFSKLLDLVKTVPLSTIKPFLSEDAKKLIELAQIEQDDETTENAKELQQAGPDISAVAPTVINAATGLAQRVGNLGLGSMLDSGLQNLGNLNANELVSHWSSMPTQVINSINSLLKRFHSTVEEEAETTDEANVDDRSDGPAAHSAGTYSSADHSMNIDTSIMHQPHNQNPTNWRSL